MQVRRSCNHLDGGCGFGWVAGGGKVGCYHRPDQDKGGRSGGGQGVQSRVARVARLYPGPGQKSALRKIRYPGEKLTLNQVIYSMISAQDPIIMMGSKTKLFFLSTTVCLQ